MALGLSKHEIQRKLADLSGFSKGKTCPAGPKGSKDPNVTKASEGQKALKDWKTILED